MNLARFSLGGTAGLITSMGLIAGLSYGSNPKASLIGGLLVIAIADNVSDSFALHVYEESASTDKSAVFMATIGNFLVRLIVGLTFVVLVILLRPRELVVVASAWGLLLLGVLSYHVSKRVGHPAMEVLRHLVAAVVVIGVSRYLGATIAHRF
jgi:hypothetical protein